MLKNFLKYYFRSISRRKLFSFINICGLGFAIAFVILIGQYLYNEFNYNSNLKDVDNIYRLANDKNDIWGYEIDYTAKDKILENVSGVKGACIMNKFGVVVTKGKDIIHFDNMLVVDIDFFEMFNIKFIRGDKSAIKSVDAIILTESTAKKIFGSIDVIGKSIVIDFNTQLFVSGIIKDLSKDISLQADLLINYENSVKERISFKKSDVGDVVSYPFNIFIKINEATDIYIINRQISKLYKANCVPLKTNYFNTYYDDSVLQHGNLRLIKILSLVCIIILLLAVINFINLTTSSYKYRLKELGIKKCVGATGNQLKAQLIIEAFLICFFASIIGIGFAEILLPYFNRFIDKPLHLQIFSNLKFVLYFILFIILLSFTAGFFPAVILSKISPLQLFKQNLFLKGVGRIYRNILIVFQFTVSIILVFSLIVISKQIGYVKHKNLGFNTVQLLYICINSQMEDKISALSNKIGQYPEIKAISLTMGVPGMINMVINDMNVIAIDSTSLKTFGFNVIEGRTLLNGDFRRTCYINETAKKEYANDEFKRGKFNGHEIIGVVSDFHIASMYNKNKPVALIYTDEWGFNCVTIKVKGSVEQAIKNIKSVWKEIYPDFPIDIKFYDEHFASMYRKEENLAALLGIFTVLAIVISCMGILGLAVFQSEQKIKEIGIRKVLGADSFKITYLLTNNFIRWVIISNIFAIPVAYYFMNKWLQDFAYRIEITWWMFLFSGGIALAIALATVSFQAIKAATANPVESLKYE